jgi:hypothetical protein
VWCVIQIICQMLSNSVEGIYNISLSLFSISWALDSRECKSLSCFAINSGKQLRFGVHRREALAKAVCLFTFEYVNFASGASILIRNAFQWKVFMQSFVASVNLELKCAEIALLISETWLQRV